MLFTNLYILVGYQSILTSLNVDGQCAVAASRCVLVFWKCMKVCYIQVFVYCPHPSMCACHYKGIQVHTRVCAHTSVCAQVGWKGHVPSSTSVYECKQQQPKWRWGVLKWRSWCTVIRFQWGHRRIRRGPGKVRAARACSTCHLVSSRVIRSLGSCTIWFHR